MTMKQVAVFLSGVGGTGKTSIITQLRDLDVPFTFEVMPSITRQVYQSLGIKDEKTNLEMTHAEREAFQAEIIKTYKRSVKNFAYDHKDKDALIFERSIFDYASYQLSVFPDWTREKIAGLREDAETFNAWVNEKFEVRNVYMPFPQPWTPEPSTDMRHAPDGKNFQWDCILKTVTKEWAANTSKMRLKLASTTVKGRAYEVASLIHLARSKLA